MDQIVIEDLRVFAHHGVYREENEKGQNFYVNAVLDTDTRRAGIMDDLDLTTNYGEVCVWIDSFLREHTYKLLETAAERTAEAYQARFSGGAQTRSADSALFPVGVCQDRPGMAQGLPVLRLQCGRPQGAFGRRRRGAAG